MVRRCLLVQAPTTGCTSAWPQEKTVMIVRVSFNSSWTFWHHPGVARILLFITGAILDEQFMPCAMYQHWSLMGSSIWVNMLMSLRTHLLLSEFQLQLKFEHKTQLNCWCDREQREHRVFAALLRSVPGLEERLMSVDLPEELHIIATLVCTGDLGILLKSNGVIFGTFRRVHQVQGLMIQKVWSLLL